MKILYVTLVTLFTITPMSSFSPDKLLVLVSSAALSSYSMIKQGYYWS